MFTNNQDIYFSCTQCGKCCDKPPRVNFYEMLELSDKFIFQTAHHTMISHAEHPLDKSLSLHYQIIGHTIMMPELEASLFYFIDFMPIQFISHKSCDQLKDNLCQIYGSRPITCRLSPFSAFFDEQDQWKTINFFKEQADKNEWNCSFDKPSPLVYKNNDLYSPSQSALYHQEILNVRNITDKYIEYLSLQGEDKKNNHFKSLFDAMQKNALIITDVIFILQAAIFYNLIDQALAERFIINQKGLLEKELNKAIELKNKDDLPTSRLYQRMLEDYSKVLNTRLFKQDVTDNFNVI